MLYSKVALSHLWSEQIKNTWSRGIYLHPCYEIMDILNKKEKRVIKLFIMETLGFTALTFLSIYLRSGSGGGTRDFLGMFSLIFAFFSVSSIIALVLIRRNLLRRLANDSPMPIID